MEQIEFENQENENRLKLLHQGSQEGNKHDAEAPEEPAPSEEVALALSAAFLTRQVGWRDWLVGGYIAPITKKVVNIASQQLGYNAYGASGKSEGVPVFKSHAR